MAGVQFKAMAHTAGERLKRGRALAGKSQTPSTLAKARQSTGLRCRYGELPGQPGQKGKLQFRERPCVKTPDKDAHCSSVAFTGIMHMCTYSSIHMHTRHTHTNTHTSVCATCIK